MGQGFWEGSVTGCEEREVTMRLRSLSKVPGWLVELFLKRGLRGRMGFIYSFFMHSFVYFKKKKKEAY